MLRKPKQKLTKRAVEGLQCEEKEFIVWDTEIPGFGVRVRPSSGRRVYILKYRTKKGTPRKPAIGPHGNITTEQARSIARTWLAEVHKGGDPAAETEAGRNAPSLSEFAERYMKQHAEVKKRPLSVAGDEQNLRNHILPKLGRKKLIDINRQDLIRFHHSLKDKPGAANRCVALLSKMFNLAEKWGQRPDGSNPCRHVERYKEHRIERFLSNDELAHLGEVLTEAERTGSELPSAIAAIRLLLFTGCRRSEILTLKWEHMDFERHCLRLPESKTGAKTVYLSPPALEVLTGIERGEDNPYVITGAKPGSHLVNLTKPWHRIRAKAGLDDVRLHDLRHSFASVAVAGGLSLPLIGALLGHTQPQTTARYAHLAADPLRQATDMVGRRIAAAMEPARGTEQDRAG
ncbi:MAG: site-specific integrase [Gammaproteobacteria bacterium]|nr:site-specific integrase [Gammaproteobacteria bacterium]